MHRNLAIRVLSDSRRPEEVRVQSALSSALHEKVLHPSKPQEMQQGWERRAVGGTRFDHTALHRPALVVFHEVLEADALSLEAVGQQLVQNVAGLDLQK